MRMVYVQPLRFILVTTIAVTVDVTVVGIWEMQRMMTDIINTLYCIGAGALISGITIAKLEGQDERKNESGRAVERGPKHGGDDAEGAG